MSWCVRLGTQGGGEPQIGNYLDMPDNTASGDLWNPPDTESTMGISYGLFVCGCGCGCAVSFLYLLCGPVPEECTEEKEEGAEEEEGEEEEEEEDF